MNTVTDPMLDLSNALAFREAIVLAGIADALESTRVFTEAVEASQAPAVVPLSRNGSQPGPATGDGGNDSIIRSGGLDHEQLRALARCESGLDPYAGDPSPYRTGFWGIEAGYAIGNLSVAEQEAWVQRIYAEFGSSAWGCKI